MELPIKLSDYCLQPHQIKDFTTDTFLRNPQKKGIFEISKILKSRRFLSNVTGLQYYRFQQNRFQEKCFV